MKRKTKGNLQKLPLAELFCVGAKVKCINDKGLPEYVKKMGVKKGKIFTIRDIGQKDFHNDGGGLRLEGIKLFSDTTGFEKCFKRSRFEIVD